MTPEELNDMKGYSNRKPTKAELELEVLTGHIEEVQIYPIDLVLPRLYSLTQIDEYLKQSRWRLIDEILKIFINKYYWRETGGKVDFKDFDIFPIISCNNLKEFKKLIKIVRFDLLEVIVLKVRELKEEIYRK